MKNLFFSIVVSTLFVSTAANAGWDRQFKKDDFTDKTSLRYLAVDQKGSRGMFLLLDCTEKGNIDFSWQVSDSNNSKAPYSGMTFEVNVRVDANPIFKETWDWAAYGPFVSPGREQRAAFLEKLKGGKKLALKVDFPEVVGVFDITGFDKAYEEVKTLCGK